MEYCVDLDIGMDWILKDKNYFEVLSSRVNNDSPAHFYLPVTDLSNEFLDWCKSLNCQIWYSEIFYTPPGGSIFKHSDYLQPADCCKINWVYNEGDSYMRWFIIKEGAELKLRKNEIGGEYLACDSDDDYILKYQHKIGKPTLVNAAEPHDVINPSIFPRWAVSIVFREIGQDWRIGYKRFREILSSYIKTPSTIGL